MTAPAPKYRWLGLVMWVGVCLAASGIGAAVTAPQIRGWYATLTKPSWSPPDWVFGPVWTALYLSMGIAAWLVWRPGGWSMARRPLAWFAVQLGLNSLWSCVFFELRSPGWAFAEILLLWMAVVGTTAAFWRRSVVAGWLFVPYLAWVSFAALLNFAVWRLNA
jgi:benzodiazapine receptor